MTVKELIENKEEVYRAAFDFYGRDVLLRWMMEECSELITAVSHFHRGKVPTETVLDEAADVLTMLLQLARFLGPDEFDRIFEDKCSRFARKVSSQVQFRKVKDETTNRPD